MIRLIIILIEGLGLFSQLQILCKPILAVSNTSFTLQVKTVQTKPGYQMRSSNRSVQQIEYFGFVEMSPGVDKAGLTWSV